MNNPRKLSSRQQSAEEQLQQAGRHSALEFNSAEEMLRHDALHTPVPPTIATRLARSLKGLEKPADTRPWWKRLLGS